MTNQSMFKKMASAIGQLSGQSPTGTAWDTAQTWKKEAGDLISKVFGEVPEVRDRLLGRLKGLFVPSPCGAIDGDFIASSSDEDARRDFENDIATAQDIMDDCCRELERLSKKFNQE